MDLAPVSYPGGVFSPARYRTATACHACTTVAPVPLASLATAAIPLQSLNPLPLFQRNEASRRFTYIAHILHSFPPPNGIISFALGSRSGLIALSRSCDRFWAGGCLSRGLRTIKLLRIARRDRKPVAVHGVKSNLQGRCNRFPKGRLTVC